ITLLLDHDPVALCVQPGHSLLESSRLIGVRRLVHRRTRRLKSGTPETEKLDLHSNHLHSYCPEEPNPLSWRWLGGNTMVGSHCRSSISQWKVSWASRVPAGMNRSWLVRLNTPTNNSPR